MFLMLLLSYLLYIAPCFFPKRAEGRYTHDEDIFIATTYLESPAALPEHTQTLITDSTTVIVHSTVLESVDTSHFPSTTHEMTSIVEFASSSPPTELETYTSAFTSEESSIVFEHSSQISSFIPTSGYATEVLATTQESAPSSTTYIESSPISEIPSISTNPSDQSHYYPTKDFEISQASPINENNEDDEEFLKITDEIRLLHNKLDLIEEINEKIMQDIENLASELGLEAKLVLKLATLKQPPELSEEEITSLLREQLKQYFRARLAMDEPIPLILTSIHSDSQSIGTPALRVFLKGEKHRFNDEIKGDSNGIRCINGHSAVFSFWVPTNQKIYGFGGSSCNFRILKIIAKQRHSVVYTSGAVPVENKEFLIKFDQPITATKVIIEVTHNDSEDKQCIGHFKAIAYPTFV